MASYSVAEAKNRFSALINAAERGERVEITRYGRPVVVMVSKDQAPAEPKLTSWDSIQRVRDAIAHIKIKGAEHISLVEEMREEDW